MERVRFWGGRSDGQDPYHGWQVLVGRPGGLYWSRPKTIFHRHAIDLVRSKPREFWATRTFVDVRMLEVEMRAEARGT